jgi:DNA-binding winged helix-turn-helix (wHTH) protein/tetratricopeptide (TPR) repeat protein
MKEFPPFQLDTVNQCLWRHIDAGDRQPVVLTPKAFAVLRYLVEHAGRLVTHNELLDSLWPDTYVQPEVLKNHILQIRNVLCDDPKEPAYIKTLPRRGYQFIARVGDGAPVASRASAVVISTKLVGRDRLLRNLRDDLQRAMNGRRQTVFITGEPGIGKTALADEFQRQAGDAQGVRIARGQCIEGYGGKEAYYPMLEALGQLCHDSTSDAVTEVLAAQAPTWLVQFPALLERKRIEMLQREIRGATRQRMLREIAEAVETITTEIPLLLVFEDLQWVDPSTVDLISALARRRLPAKLMLVGTYRPVDVALGEHPLKTLKQELLLHKLCHEIALEALGESEVAEYLAAEAPAGNLPPELTELVYRRSEGNPLFMVTALEHMAERGLISREGSTWQLRVPLKKIDLEVPDTLRQMIEARIERLSREEEQVLQVASVTGFVFSPSIAASASNLGCDEFEDLCEELSRRHRIVRSAGSQQLPNSKVAHRYEFVHELYREVLYGRQAPGRRAKLHQRIGERLEELFSVDPAAVAPELAHHFEQSCDWSRAIKYLGLVAETAVRRYAPREAVDVLQHALELSRKLPCPEGIVTETEILEKLAGIYVVSFDERAPEVYEALAKRAADHGLIDVEVRALIDMAYPMSWISAPRCLKVLERALQLSDQQSDPLTRARTRASCFVRRVWVGGWNKQDAEECRNALAEIRQLGDRFVVASHLIDCNFIEWSSSEYREAQGNAVESLAIVLDTREENRYLSFAYWLSQFILPWSLLFLGEWGEALREIQGGITLADKNGDHYRAQTLLLYQAWVHLHATDFAGVRTICESVLPSVEDPTRRPWRRFCLALAGSAETALGNYDRAIEYLLRARHEMNQQAVIHDWYCRMLLQSALTELRLAKGDLRKAKTEAEQFLDMTEATAERTWQALACEMNARVAMAEADLPRAQDFVARGLSAMEGFEVPLAAWRVHATAARLHKCTGDIELEERHREQSRKTILNLADSLPAESQLRSTFLSDPIVFAILKTSEAPLSRARAG